MIIWILSNITLVYKHSDTILFINYPLLIIIFCLNWKLFFSLRQQTDIFEQTPFLKETECFSSCFSHYFCSSRESCCRLSRFMVVIPVLRHTMHHTLVCCWLDNVMVLWIFLPLIFHRENWKLLLQFLFVNFLKPLFWMIIVYMLCTRVKVTQEIETNFDFFRSD